MPNWVKNKIQAPESVIRALLNDKNEADFARILPDPCPHGADWDGVYTDAETLAKKVLGFPLGDHPLLAALERSNREDANAQRLSDEGFEQFVGMLRNHRACGFLHAIEFSQSAWGTKWNACDTEADPVAGTAIFQTAWSCPTPVLEALSRQFPEAEIAVTFASEDFGSECGQLTLLNGEAIKSSVAPPWKDLAEAERASWLKFAREVWSREEEPEDAE